MQYWQFRFRLWLALKYNYIREEVAFRFGLYVVKYAANGVELDPIVSRGRNISPNDDIFFLNSEELRGAVEARIMARPLSITQPATAERRGVAGSTETASSPELTLPPEVRLTRCGVVQRLGQNGADSDTMHGFPVSSGGDYEASIVLRTI